MNGAAHDSEADPSVGASPHVRDAMEQAVSTLRALAPESVAGESDDGLLELLSRLSELRRVTDAVSAGAAVEIQRRSRAELGDASLARRHGRTNGADLVQFVTRQPRKLVNRMLRLGRIVAVRRALDGTPLPAKYPVLTEAVLAGEVDGTAATTIAAALDDAPAACDSAMLVAAERCLVDEARVLIPELVEVEAKVWRAVIDPDGAEPREDRQRRLRSLTLGPVGDDGTSLLKAVCPPEQRALLEAVFTTYDNPRSAVAFLDPADGDGRADDETAGGSTVDTDGEHDRALDGALDGEDAAPPIVDLRSRAQRRFDILIGVIGAGLRASETESGALREIARVVVTTTVDELASGRGTAWLDGIAEPVSAITAQRLACDAGLQKLVLGSRGEVLALGTRVEFFTTAQRTALGARDGGCVWPGCTAPPAWCEAHHVTFRRDNGPTDIDNAASYQYTLYIDAECARLGSSHQRRRVSMLNRENLEKFKATLSIATRQSSTADEALAKRFIELKPGLLTTLGAPINHLVTGRRGVGKSTTLALLQRRAEAEGDWVIFVDVETHKDRSYPDVLIEIILEILEAVRPRPYTLNRLKTYRSIRRLMAVLRYLRDAAEEVTETAETATRTNRGAGIALSAGIERKYLRLAGNLGASREATRSTRQSSTRVRRKDAYLRDLAPAIARELEAATSVAGKKKLLLVLDDFYFIATDTQPLVLDHLHGITKRSKVWLKIGSVHSRTRSYVEGDPPRGMQPPNDLQHLSLDVGLADFSTAKGFLEDVADGVLEPVGLSIRETMTDTARERAVLVAGGAVSRDYFDLLIAAADAEWDRTQKRGNRDGEFRISAESVQAAAGRMLERKQTDLRNDAGRDVQPLEARFADLVAFVRDRDTYFFLVKRTEIDSDWGRQVVQLEDLRFVHRIMVTRPNTGSMRRQDAVVFMVDIPALVDTRMQKLPVEFWKPRKSDELRKSNWVYSPGWTRNVSGPQRRPSAKADAGA